MSAAKNQPHAAEPAIQLRGAEYSDGEALPLIVGANVITVSVTAEDGATTLTYTVTVTRAEPTTSPNEVEVWSATMTVGESGAALRGYALDATGISNFGALDDADFEYDGIQRKVEAIITSSAGFRLDLSGDSGFDDDAASLRDASPALRLYVTNHSGGTETRLLSSSSRPIPTGSRGP